MDISSTGNSVMYMFTAPIAMNSAQVPSSNWMVDSGAGMSSISSTNNLKNTMRCKIPITPAFGSVMNATSEGIINDPTFDKLEIKAIHIEGMHHNLLSVYQVCAVGESGEEQVGILTQCKEALKITSKCIKILVPTYIVLIVNDIKTYWNTRISKEVIFDESVVFDKYIENSPTDEEFAALPVIIESLHEGPQNRVKKVRFDDEDKHEQVHMPDPTPDDILEPEPTERNISPQLELCNPQD